MKAFHLLGAAPLYTNSFVLISDAGHAVVIDPAAEVQESGSVVQVFQKGYKIGDKIIRHAMVVVAE